MLFSTTLKKLTLSFLLSVLSFPLVWAQSLALKGFVPQFRQGTIYFIDILSPERDTVGQAEVRENQFYLQAPWPAHQSRVAVLSYLFQNDSTVFSGAAFAEMDTLVQMRFAENVMDPPVFSGSENMKIINAFIHNIGSLQKLMALAPNQDSLNTLKTKMAQEVYELIKTHHRDDLANFSLTMLVALLQGQLLNGEHLAYFYEICQSQKTNSLLAQYIEPILAKLQLLGNSAPTFPLLFEPDSPPFPNGKQTLLVFWASWCGPCVKNIPLLNDLFRKYHPALQIIGISSDKEVRAHEQAQQKHQIAWPSQLDQPLADGRTIGEHYQANTLPFYVLVDEAGRITQMSMRLQEIILHLEKN